VQRKLTTIIIADVAGYSRLMSRDEEGTHARLHALLRQLVEPAIDARAGRVIKTTGDGFLAEFASVVEAVRCAIEIQEGAARRNAGLSSEEGIAFRIGVNLGDVIAEGDDIYGDGVNIAARLEGLAEPGGIVVSRAVRDHVRDKLDIAFDDLGEQTVKNIPRPVRAFRVREQGAEADPAAAARPRNLRRGVLAGAAALAVAVAIGGVMVWLGPADPPPAATATAATPSSVADTLPAKPAPPLSIIVLPFANLGSDTQRDYVADGITQSLTTDLSRALPGSFVVARGTAYSYKGKQVDPRQVGRDLNVPISWREASSPTATGCASAPS
jgi:adenylate cyclase